MSARSAAPPSRRGRVVQLLGVRARRDHETDEVLRALGVATRPEHVLDGARRQHGHGAGQRQRRDLDDALVQIAGGALEHPDVLRAGCGLAVIDQGREPADQRSVDRAVAHGECAQHERVGVRPARRAAGVAPRGRLRQRQPLLTDEPVRCRADPIAQLRGVEPDEVRRAAVDLADDVPVRVRFDRREHRRESFGVAAPRGGNGRQTQLLAEQPLAHRRHERHEPGVLEHAGAQAVHESHAAAAHGLGEPGDAQLRARTQFERVAPLGIHASQDHVDPLVRFVLREACGLHPHPPVAHDEVFALHEREAEDVGDERLVVRGLGVRAGRQHDHARVGDLGRRGLQQRRAERREVRLHAVQARPPRTARAARARAPAGSPSRSRGRRAPARGRSARATPPRRRDRDRCSRGSAGAGRSRGRGRSGACSPSGRRRRPTGMTPSASSRCSP